ncbi:hypothetical protein WA158_007181 [Blastocystis sp. Blastoise]
MVEENTKPTVEETEPKEIEEVHSEDENVEVPQGSMRAGKQSRNEKKARKALLKLGLTHVPGVLRVAMKKDATIDMFLIYYLYTVFSVNQPDVFKAPETSSYVIFGDIKVEDITPQARAAEAAAKSIATQKPAFIIINAAPEAAVATAEEPADEEEVDATGIEDSDISFVMEQTSCTRNKAIAAIKKSNGDMVNAIMSLTE